MRTKASQPTARGRRHLLKVLAAGLFASPAAQRARAGVGHAAGGPASSPPASGEPDPVYAAFEEARQDKAWTLGFTTAARRSYPPQDLERVHGTPPEGLRGVLFRNGPGIHDRNGWRYRHWFDGDGLVHRWQIADGTARHRAEFVGTRKYTEEEAAGRFLYATFGSLPPGAQGLGSPNDMNAANTSVLPLAERLYALWEGGSAYELDPDTLATVGPKTWGTGLAGMPFSAHPKVDPSGDVWNFAADPFGGRVILYHIGADGTLKKATLRIIDTASLIHDFVVTERHVILVAPSLAIGKMRLPLIASFAAAPDQPMVAYAFTKADFAPAGRWELPPAFVFHFGNGFEDADGTLRFDYFQHATSYFATDGAQALMRGEALAEPPPRMASAALHPDGSATSEPIAEAPGEFPRVDDRYTGRRHRYTWHVADSGSVGTPYRANGLAGLDWRTERLDRFDFGSTVLAEEHVFVARRPDSAEGDGWLVGTALDLKAERTLLQVFDARRVSDGPLCQWAAPYALPLGFHGAWSGRV